MAGFYEACSPEIVSSPRVIRFNAPLAEALDIHVDPKDAPGIFSGNVIAENASPLAQCYAGHQFGQFSPRLGDGRAHLLGEVITERGERFDVQLKGSGRTPFSRGGDGKAALGPVLREYLISEAMWALGIPTTRSLAAVVTDDVVIRETAKPRAVLTRVAASHIRVGTFEYFAARGEVEKVKQLADYATARHFSEINNREDKYLAFYGEVIKRQARLIAQWMSVGFIHGVMNTDNMSISGETIDYGPCAFMDYYSPDTVFSSIDTYGRYAYENQPKIAHWNLAQLGRALIALVDPDSKVAIDKLSEALDAFPAIYEENRIELFGQKVGIADIQDGDQQLIHDLLELMADEKVDFTSGFLKLSHFAVDDGKGFLSLFSSNDNVRGWIERWVKRISDSAGAIDTACSMMQRVNPIYIPRNHKVEEAIHEAVEEKRFDAFDALLSRIQEPFRNVEGSDSFATPAPEAFFPYVTFCGT